MSKPILIIDAGHGGKDPGAVSKFGAEEDFTLKISLYQYERFKELGVPVAITRTSDVTLEENERVAKVKNSGAKYCISNHLNAGGGDRGEVIHSIYSDGKLANLIKSELLVVGQSNVKVFSKKGTSGDYYYMHRRTGAVETNIVEYCFIDNEADFKHFNSNWEAYAESVVKAFCSHIGHAYSPKNPIPYWKQEGSKWFYFEGGKKVANRWVKWKGIWYWLGVDGVMVANSFIMYKGNWFYLESSGAMRTKAINIKADGSLDI